MPSPRVFLCPTQILLECPTPESPFAEAQPQSLPGVPNPRVSPECPASKSTPVNARVFLECPTQNCPRSAQPQSVPGVPNLRISLLARTGDKATRQRVGMFEVRCLLLERLSKTSCRAQLQGSVIGFLGFRVRGVQIKYLSGSGLRFTANSRRTCLSCGSCGKHSQALLTHPQNLTLNLKPSTLNPKL